MQYIYIYISATYIYTHTPTHVCVYTFPDHSKSTSNFRTMLWIQNGSAELLGEGPWAIQVSERVHLLQSRYSNIFQPTTIQKWTLICAKPYHWNRRIIPMGGYTSWTTDHVFFWYNLFKQRHVPICPKISLPPSIRFCWNETWVWYWICAFDFLGGPVWGVLKLHWQYLLWFQNGQTMLNYRMKHHHFGA